MAKPTLRPLDEQVVVVMGASSGIGRETARRFAAAGAGVVVSARSTDALDRVVDEVVAAGGRAVAQPADVTDFEAVASVAQRAVDEFGGLDTWAHVAGISAYGRFEELHPDEIRRVIEVDLVGPAFGAHAAIPHLRRRGGVALILVSSVLGEMPLPLQAPYVAAKHGLKGLGAGIRIELAGGDDAISVTTVLPSSTDTPLFDKARSRLGVVPTAPPPIYAPELVADAIVHAATHPDREVVVGGGGKVATLLGRLLPGTTETLAAVGGEATTRTDEPVPGVRAGNLDEPTGPHTVHGHFDVTLHRSLWTRLDLRRTGRGVLDAAASLGRRIARTAGRHRTRPGPPSGLANP